MPSTRRGIASAVFCKGWLPPLVKAIVSKISKGVMNPYDHV